MTARILQYLAVFLLWNVVAGLSLILLPAPLGLLIAFALALLLLYRFVLRTGRPGARRHWALLRLRPLEGEALRWVVLSVPVFLILAWSVGEVYTSLVPVPPEAFNPFGPLSRDPLGRLSIALLAIAVAPLLEEFFFRGLIQRSLELRWGAAPGIIFTAVLFALVHMLPWVLPLHLFLGLVFGWVVYATRSIWAGVVLHAANNAAAVIGLGVGEDPATRPTLWDAGADAALWTALVVLLLSTAAAVWVAGKMWETRVSAA